MWHENESQNPKPCISYYICFIQQANQTINHLDLYVLQDQVLATMTLVLDSV